MSHNTFDVTETNGKFTAKSHNFKTCTGEGRSLHEAVKAMEKSIIYIKDNMPAMYASNVKDRISKGLACGCGHKLDDPIFWVHGG